MAELLFSLQRETRRRDEMARILIIDDSETIRVQLKSILQGGGFEIIEADNGLNALNLVQDASEVSLIICDVNMPVMDGLTFCAKLRELAHRKATPVLMLTTESNPELKAKGKAAGVIAWVLKPLDGPKLLAVVQKITGGKT
jgi:two-component system, chemotaxis family, chemotaxis protein CheY